MKTTVRKWGNSLALRIPKSIAAEAGIAESASVNLTLVKGKLVIEPIESSPVRLEDLLARITPENLHDAWETGPAVGKEIW